MILRSSPHVHTTYVDGKNTAEEMVLAAIDAGFISMGFSEHGTQVFDEIYNLSEADTKAYIAEVKRLQTAYAGKIRIHLGIERDTHSTALREDYEYVLGSAHYLQSGDEFCAVDGPIEPLIKCSNECFGGDSVKLACSYFQQLADYATAYRPQILGHFDLIRKGNANNRLYNAQDKRLICAQYEALEAIYHSGALLELNTGGMARGYLDSPYPELFLLKHWNKLGGGVIVGSDSHSATTIDFAFDQMPHLLGEAGFVSIWELGGEGEAQFVERPLI